MYRSSVLACLLCVGFVAASNPSFSLGAGSVPQLIMQQEVMRRVADVYLGFSAATHFQMMGGYEMRSWQSPDARFVKYDFYNEDSQDTLDFTSDFSDSGFFSTDSSEESTSDSDAFLEVESHVKKGRSLEMMPVFAQQPAAAAPANSAEELDFDDLQHRGALEKVHALKFLQMQIALAASDVDKAYWMNKLLATYLPPQLMTMKVYKNYVSTLALSFMIQLHDSFTQEAFQDEFNDHYGDLVLGSSFVTEAYAEHKTYATWFYLSVLKFQLFFVNMYEQMYASQSAAGAYGQQPQQGSGSSFLETEPSFSLHPSSLMTQYVYVSYFNYVLKFYGVYLEMMLSQQGMMMGQLKLQAFLMHRDETPSNDGDADKMIDHAKEIDSKYLPGAFSSWATVNQWRFMFDFYLLFLELQIPAVAANQMAINAEDAVQNTNFVQTSEPVLTK